MAAQDPQWSVTPQYWSGSTTGTVTFSSPPTFAATSLTCSICGATVGDQFLHSQWHENVSEAVIANLQKMEKELIRE